MDVRPLYAASRRLAETLGIARQAGGAVDDLAQRFAVTPQTIRRDLTNCARPALTCVQGGAVIASGIENLAFEARKAVAAPHKRLIGAVAASLVPGHSSSFINIGTTTEAVARALAGHAGLLVITGNLHIAGELCRNPAIEAVLAGEVIRHSGGGIVGPAPSRKPRRSRFSCSRRGAGNGHAR